MILLSTSAAFAARRLNIIDSAVDKWRERRRTCVQANVDTLWATSYVKKRFIFVEYDTLFKFHLLYFERDFWLAEISSATRLSYGKKYCFGVNWVLFLQWKKCETRWLNAIYCASRVRGRTNSWAKMYDFSDIASHRPPRMQPHCSALSSVTWCSDTFEKAEAGCGFFSRPWMN